MPATTYEKPIIYPGSILPVHYDGEYDSPLALAFFSEVAKLSVTPMVPQVLLAETISKVRVNPDDPTVLEALERAGVQVQVTRNSYGEIIGQSLTMDKAKEITLPVADEVQDYLKENNLKANGTRLEERITFLRSYQGGTTKEKIIIFSDGTLFYVPANGQEESILGSQVLGELSLQLSGPGVNLDRIGQAITSVTNLAEHSRTQVPVATVINEEGLAMGTIRPVFKTVDTYVGDDSTVFFTRSGLAMAKIAIDS